MFARVCTMTALLGATLLGEARADVGGNIPLDTFRPAIDSRGYFTINASQTLGDKDVSFGLGSLDWGHGLLKLGDASTCNASSGAACYRVNDMLTATLIAAFGIHAGPAELE